MEDIEKRRILVIEDEEHIAEGIKLNLSIQGYEVMVAADGIDGLDRWRTWHPDLIVLDIMLPMVDGYAVLQTIRKEDEKLPVLILSAKGATRDKIRGLECGVDDYLAKPFDLDEFLLRVKRLLERHSWYAQAVGTSRTSPSPGELYEGDFYQFGDNRVDFITCSARCMAGDIILTEQEMYDDHLTAHSVHGSQKFIGESWCIVIYHVHLRVLQWYIHNIWSHHDDLYPIFPQHVFYPLHVRWIEILVVQNYSSNLEKIGELLPQLFRILEPKANAHYEE